MSEQTAPGHTAASTTYLEVAVYTVREPASFPAVRAAARQELQRQPGFLWWERLRADDGTQADVLAWAGAEHGRAAATTVSADPVYRPFVQGIAEMRHFAHYHAAADAERLRDDVRRARLVEIATYTVHDPAAFARAQRLLHEAKLPGTVGLVGAARLVAQGVERGFGDLLGWDAAASHARTGAAMMALPELAPFFGGIDQMAAFQLFTRDTTAHAP